MSYKILETDETLNDLCAIAINAYNFTRYTSSGDNVLIAYDTTVKCLCDFPNKFRGISIEHRGYEIRIRAFGNYNLFFCVDEAKGEVIILRVLYQKQNWEHILKLENLYHIEGTVI